MIQTLLTRSLQFLLLLALQVLVLNHIHVMGYASPMVYVTLLLYFPMDANRVGTLLWAFAMGMVVDIFSNTPGVASASMTLAAVIQPYLLSALAPKESVEDLVPTYHSMGVARHIYYIIVLVAIQVIVAFLLEYFSFYNVVDMLISMGSSMGLSLIIILTLETLRGRRKQVEE